MVSITAASAETSSAVFNCPTCSVIFAVTSWLKVTSTPFSSDLVKPLAVTVRSYVPTNKLLKRYWPAEVVVTVVVMPVLSFVAVTKAFGTTEFAASNIVPVSSPEVLCAKAAKLRAMSTMPAAASRVRSLQIRISIWHLYIVRHPAPRCERQIRCYV